MSNEDFAPNWSDQGGIFDPDSFVGTITIIGAGGIGASLIPTLVTVGFRRFIIYDPDRVEDRNIASQLLYKPRDLYRPKVEVCQEYIQTYGDCQVVVEVHQRLFTAEDRITTPVVISAVDNQDARRMIWQAVQDSPDVRLLIDGRIGSEAFTCLAVDMLDDSDWYDTKFLGDNIAHLPCASRAIAYPAVALGAVITRHLVHWHAGEELPRRVSQDMRDLVQLVIQAPK